MVVSITSMKVGMTTATATNQGLIVGRLTAVGARAALLMVRGQEWLVGWVESSERTSLAYGGFRRLHPPYCFHGLGSVGAVGSGAIACSLAPAFGPVGGSL